MDLVGAWASGEWLSPEETALLSLLKGDVKEMQLVLPDGTAHIREAKANAKLSEDGRSARITLAADVTASDLNNDVLERSIADAALSLMTKLSRQSCDALGLGRQHVCRYRDMTQWHEADWPRMYREIRWEIEVGMTGPA